MLVLGSVITTILSISCIYAMDDNKTQEITTFNNDVLKDKADSQQENKNNQIESKSYTFMSSSVYRSDGSNYDSASHTSERTISGNHDGTTYVNESTTKDRKTRINDKEFVGSSKENKEANYDLNKNVVFSRSKSLADLKTDKKKMSVTANKQYNRDRGSSIENKVVQNGKEISNINKTYNINETSKCRSDSKQINKQNKKMCSDFYRGFLKDANETDKTIEGNKNLITSSENIKSNKSDMSYLDKNEEKFNHEFKKNLDYDKNINSINKSKDDMSYWNNKERKLNREFKKNLDDNNNINMYKSRTDKNNNNNTCYGEDCNNKANAKNNLINSKNKVNEYNTNNIGNSSYMEDFDELNNDPELTK